VAGLATDGALDGEAMATAAGALLHDAHTLQAETVATLHHTPLKHTTYV